MMSELNEMMRLKLLSEGLESLATPKCMEDAHKLITEEEVTKTLRNDKGKDAVLKSWEIVDFTKLGDNYACFVTSVEVEYSGVNEGGQDVSGKTSYVVKLNPCRNMPGFDELVNVFFTKEGKFYTDIIPELNTVLLACGIEPLRFPTCYHANLELDREQIFFEDLRNRGFKMIDRKKGMDSKHNSLVLKELAKLHAASHLLQAQNPTEPLEKKFDFLLKDWMNFTENSKDLMLSMLQGHIHNGAKMLRKVGYHERAIKWVEELAPQLEDILTNRIKSEKFDTIGHGDCWNNNILFRHNSEGDPIEVMLLDLQICRKSSIAVDLNYFLYTSLDGSGRGPHLNDILSTYHNAYKVVLEAGGKSMYFTEEELMSEFKDKNVFGVIFALMVLPAVLMESDEVPDITSGDKTFDEIMEDLKATALEMLGSNPLLKPRFLAIFDELMEDGLIP